MSRVAGKVALVTGGAAGIGEATARLLAREGARVMVTDIDDAAGNAVADSISAAGGQAIYLHHDVSSERHWEAAVRIAVERFGRLDVLVNNAGIARSGPPEEESLEGWRQLMSVNLDGVFLGTRQAILAMKAQSPAGGSIINISSIEGLVGDPNLGTYNASKGGVRLYTKSVAIYCAGAGLDIRVNSVHPGYVWTPMVEAYLQEQANPVAARAAIEALHPVGHMGEPDDIAYGILYLASDEARFVTGAELVIDGGYTAQ